MAEGLGLGQIVHRLTKREYRDTGDLLATLRAIRGEDPEGLIEELSRLLLRVSSLLDITQILQLGADIETIIKNIVSKATELLDADRGSLFLLDRETDMLWSKVAQGAEIAEIRFPKHLGIAGHVATTGEILNIL